MRHKFFAIRTVRDGIKFSSKKEAAVYDNIRLMQAGGEIIFFLRQVPFHLPGGVKYVVDFVIFERDGLVRFVDAKGMRTPLYIAKKKIVESIYPIEIEEW